MKKWPIYIAIALFIVACGQKSFLENSWQEAKIPSALDLKFYGLDSNQGDDAVSVYFHRDTKEVDFINPKVDSYRLNTEKKEIRNLPLKNWEL